MWHGESRYHRVAAVHDAGFRVRAVHGGWDREPVGAGDGELIVEADRP